MAFSTEGAVQGAAAGTAVFPGWGTLAGGIIGGFFGGGGGSGGQVPNAQQGNYANFQTQRFLPRLLRQSGRGGVVDPFIRSGLMGIGNLIQNPGMLDANVASSIAPRLAIESERIARNVKGEQSQAAGAAARSGTSNTPFAQALQRAIAMAGSRQTADARRSALTESAMLRREDLSRVFDILNAQLAFVNSGRGIQSQQIASQAAIAGQNRAANAASLAALVQGLGNIDLSRNKTPTDFFSNPKYISGGYNPLETGGTRG